MASEDTRNRFLPVPYDGNSRLSPPIRRTLTRATEQNPTLHELNSLIPLDSNEAIQILGWAKTAQEAIVAVGQVLSTLPGETVTNSTEDVSQIKQSQGREDSREDMSSGSTIWGFFTMHIRSERTTEGSKNTFTTTNLQEQRKGAQILKTRPGQFLSGQVLEGALQRVQIARSEGLLLLPGANLQLNRLQAELIGTSKILVRDYGRQNQPWSEDIQEGILKGLTNQLEEAVTAYTDKYLSDEIERELSADGAATIKNELGTQIDQLFKDILEFSLIDIGRPETVEQAANTLETSVCRIFEKEPDKAIKMLRQWILIQIRNPNAKNRSIVSSSYARSLIYCLDRSFATANQDNISKLSNIVDETSAYGGSQMLLVTYVGVAREKPINKGVLALMVNLAKSIKIDKARHLNNEERDLLISLIRFSLVLPSEEDEDHHLTKSLVSLLCSKTEYVSGLRIKTAGVDLDQDTFIAVVQSLSAEEWRDLISFVKNPEEVWQVKFPYGKPYGPEDIATLKDPELIKTVQAELAKIVETATTEGTGYDKEFLQYCSNHITAGQKRELIDILAQAEKQAVAKAFNFIGENATAISYMSQDVQFVSLLERPEYYKDRPPRPDSQLLVDLEHILYLLNIPHSGQSIHIQLHDLENFLGKLNKYKWAYDQHKSSLPGSNLLSHSKRDRLRANCAQVFEGKDMEKLYFEIKRLVSLASIFNP